MPSWKLDEKKRKLDEKNPQRINNILGDEDLLEQVRKNGAELVKAKYSWGEIGRQTKDAYQTL